MFNFAPPPNSDDYVHRIGRTGRAGRKGESYTIVSPKDSKLWDAVLKRIGQSVETFESDAIAQAVDEVSARPDRIKRTDKKRRRDRKEKTEQPEQPSQTQTDTRDADTRPKRGGRRRHDDLGPAVKGLGDHVPAFLMRPVVIPDFSEQD